MADAAGEIEESGWKRTVKDLFSGAAGGIAQVLIGELELDRLYLYALLFGASRCFGSRVHHLDISTSVLSLESSDESFHSKSLSSAFQI